MSEQDENADGKASQEGENDSRVKVVRDAEARTVTISHSHACTLSLLIFAGICILAFAMILLGCELAKTGNSRAVVLPWAIGALFMGIVVFSFVHTFLRQSLTIDADGHCVYFSGVGNLGITRRFDVGHDTEVVLEIHRSSDMKRTLYCLRLIPPGRAIFGTNPFRKDAEELLRLVGEELSRL